MPPTMHWMERHMHDVEGGRKAHVVHKLALRRPSAAPGQRRRSPGGVLTTAGRRGLVYPPTVA